VALGATLGLAAAVLVPAGGSAQVAEYLGHDAFSRELRSVVEASNAATLSSLARSPGGREVWLVELALPGDLEPAERPALLVVGSLEGDHVVGSHLALEAIRYLTGSGNAEARALLAENTIYVVPRANPDGVEAMFGSLRWDRRVNGRAYDDDNDGRTDEDGPNDLNGDGMITLMRVADAEGAFIVHPDDARLMKRADAAAGESGTHSVYVEGGDDDGDGYFNEDGPGGVDLNRNFQHEHPYYGIEAGPHMVSEPASRALIDFAVAHGNIAAVLTYGHSDNLVRPPDARGTLGGVQTSDLAAFAAEANAGLFDVGVWSARPENLQGGLRLRGAQPGADNDPSSGRRPAVTFDEADLEYFSRVSDDYREITGLESVGLNRRAEGAFFQYGYFQFGVPSFSTQGWAPAEAEAEGAVSSLDGRMAAAGATFVDWSPATLAGVGEIEVGGFAPHATSNPPAGQLPELGARQGEFILALGGLLPRVRIVDTEVTAHGGGVFTVEAVVENSGYFPTSTQHGVVSRSVLPTQVQIGVDAADILTGNDKTTSVTKLEGSGNRMRFTWVIQGRSGASVEILARAQKGGHHTMTVTLR
jgi:hypothetical protein